MTPASALRCPQCGRSFELSAALARSPTVECPTCGQTIHRTTAASGRVDPSTLRPPPPPPPAAPPAHTPEMAIPEAELAEMLRTYLAHLLTLPTSTVTHLSTVPGDALVLDAAEVRRFARIGLALLAKRRA